MSQKKKICFVLPVHSSHTIGGAQYQAECLMNYIIGLDRYQVYYIANLADPKSNLGNFELIHLNTNYQKKNTPALLRSSKSLLDVLQRIKPDIIYQRIGCYQTGICARYAKSSNCKELYHIASDMDVSPFRLSKGKNILFKIIEKKMQDYGVRSASKIIAQTHHQAQLLKARYNREADAVVYNFHPFAANQGKKNDTVTVVWVANVKKIKQPDIFIRLANNLHPRTGAQFVMVGKMQGSKNWCRQIQKVIDETDGLTYLGSISQNEVNQLLEKAHILVNTSTVEGFSNTFIQAWMRYVPVVSLNVDPDNLLQTKKIGRLSKKYEQLIEDVKELIVRDDLRNTMGKTAFDYSIKNHSFANITKIVELMEN